MRPEHLQLAKAILTDLMSGERCVALAAQHGVSPTQARRLCLELVGLAAAAGRLDFADPEDLKSLKRLRGRHAALVVAGVVDFEPAPPGSTGGPLCEEEVAAGLARLKARSRQPLRDAAMLCILLGTGMRPVEIVRLTVADCITPRGEVRPQVEIRAEIAAHGRARTVHFASQRLVDALKDYLQSRSESAHLGGQVGSSFMGLSRSSMLFQMDRGGAFKVLPRPGGGTPLSPRAFETFAQIFIDAGWPGLSSGDVRRHLRKRLIEQQARHDEVAAMLDVRTGRQQPRTRTALRTLHAAAMDVL